MRIESRRGLKKKKKVLLTWKAYLSYFSSCYFFITPFLLHFKDDYNIFLIIMITQLKYDFNIII
jgi:hypothetical protein